jgi:excisionase family DNA binding protein
MAIFRQCQKCQTFPAPTLNILHGFEFHFASPMRIATRQNSPLFSCEKRSHSCRWWLGANLVVLFLSSRQSEQEQTVMTIYERSIPGVSRLTVRVPDALAMLGIGRTKLYALLGAGEIEAIKIGKATLILVESLEAFVARQRAGASQ